MARRKATTTLQIWPSGQSYTYRGDLYGPPNQRSLQGKQRPLDTETEAARWRRGTKDEWRAIRIAERAQRIQREDVLCCDSALVDALIKDSYDSRSDLAQEFSTEEIRNLYADVDSFDAAEVREYASDNGIDLPDEVNVWEWDRARMIDEAQARDVEPRDDSQTSDADLRAYLIDLVAENDSDMETLRDAIRDSCQENPAEVYEWWRVSSWLCRKLHELGYVTIDNGYGQWWGRTTTGQQMIMDGVLQRVAALSETGDE